MSVLVFFPLNFSLDDALLWPSIQLTFNIFSWENINLRTSGDNHDVHEEPMYDMFDCLVCLANPEQTVLSTIIKLAGGQPTQDRN